MTKLPKLTKKQIEILKLLYSYRFLNRIQIQALMGHKDPKTINLWLRDLRAKDYVEWIYSTHFAEKTKPAIYYLRLNSIRHLRDLITTNDNNETYPTYPPEELRKRYKEPTRSQTFIDRCIAIADCVITLKREDVNNKAKGKRLRHYHQTEADYLKSSYYHFVVDLGDEMIRPNLIFCQDQYDKDGNEEETLESSILEIFDPTLPRYSIKKRLSDYVKFLDDEGYEWQKQTNTSKLPIILLVCPRTSDLIYTKRRTRGLMAKIWDWDDEDTERPRIRFTTMEKLKQHGVLTESIWEQA